MDGSSRARARGLATLRIVLGVGFLWAGLEKWLNVAGDAAPWSAAGGPAGRALLSSTPKPGALIHQWILSWGAEILGTQRHAFAGARRGLSRSHGLLT